MSSPFRCILDGVSYTLGEMRAMALTQTQQFYSGMGLTTTKAPFIEVARSRGELYIEQPYELYSEENHEAWRRLYTRVISGGL
jgi:phenylalanine-4-hydroxylase